MASRHHYVARFHLREFCEPASASTTDPWLWVAACATGAIKRRSPKNFAWARGLYDGPGGLADRSRSIEDFLANQVEGPAAIALRSLTGAGLTSSIPAPLARYLAWAAARALPMRALYQSWIDDMPALEAMEPVEPPPPGLLEAKVISRLHRMTHTVHGVRDDIPSEDVDELRSAGWQLQLNADDFVELVHLQAWYFQVRFFPRLAWLTLRPPADEYFIIGDRPVVWGFAGQFDSPPRALRHTAVQLFAPLTHSLALFAHHTAARPPDLITPLQVNRIVAAAAHEWIAGPAETVVRQALNERLFQ
jgi:hypothetical protein